MVNVTGDTIFKAAIPSVADKLTLAWAYLSPGTDVPERGDMEQMARELLTTRTVTFGNKKLADFNDLDDAKKAKLRANSVDIDGLLALSEPTQRGQFAVAVDQGVERGTSWWNSIVNFFVGLFSWVTSGFRGGFAGLWEHVGQANSASVQTEVDRSVSQAMQQNPTLQAFAPYMGEVHHATHEEVMTRATGKSPEARGVPKRPTVTPLPNDPKAAKDFVEQAVNQQIDEKLKDPKTQKQLSYALAGEDAEKRTEEISTLVGDFFKNATLNKNYALGENPTSEMSPAEFKTALKKKLTEKLAEANVTGKDGKSQKLTQWYKENMASGWYRYIDQMPSDESKLPEFMAGKIIDSLSAEDLIRMKEARGFADRDFQVSINDLLTGKFVPGPDLRVAGQNYPMHSVSSAPDQFIPPAAQEGSNNRPSTPTQHIG